MGGPGARNKLRALVALSVSAGKGASLARGYRLATERGYRAGVLAMNDIEIMVK